MTWISIAGICAILAAFLAAVFWGVRKAVMRASGTAFELQSLREELRRLQESLQEHHLNVNQEFQAQLRDQSRFLQNSQQNYFETLGDVQHRLGELKQNAEKIQSLGENIASLHEILGSPKTRGSFGELLLENALHQILPQDSYEVQFTFPDGVRADAVVQIGEKKLCIDAKFPLENFKRKLAAVAEPDLAAVQKQFLTDVKKHIDSISQKYIQPAQGTFDFALMYIPAETVFYDLIVSDESNELSAYAFRKNVIFVSPNMLPAYLQIVLHALKGLKIEKTAANILSHLSGLQQFYLKCIEEHEKVGMHLNHAQAAYDRMSRRMAQFQLRLEDMEGSST